MRQPGKGIGRAGRRGFSLLELVIVVAILLGLSALVLPALHGWISRARFEETVRQLPGVFAVARAEARADGVARRVSAAPGPGGMQVITVERVEPAAAGEASGGGEAAPAVTRPPEVVLELPPGCEVGATAAEGEAGGEAPRVDGAARSIVVYLPDGGAMAGGAVVLRGPGGREAALRFDRVTGRARVGPVAVGTSTGARLEEGAAESSPASGEGGRP